MSGHVEFFVSGYPAPQGSKKAFRNRRTGRIALVEVSKRVKPWRSAVRFEALNAMRLMSDGIFRGPVIVELEFYLARPKTTKHPNCDVKPDLDKLIRATLDGLTGAAFHDDSQVVRLIALKAWALKGESPGALVIVDTIDT